MVVKPTEYRFCKILSRNTLPLSAGIEHGAPECFDECLGVDDLDCNKFVSLDQPKT